MLGCIYAATIDGWRIGLVLPLGVRTRRMRFRRRRRLDGVVRGVGCPDSPELRREVALGLVPRTPHSYSIYNNQTTLEANAMMQMPLVHYYRAHEQPLL